MRKKILIGTGVLLLILLTVGVGLAWKTTYLDRWLPLNVRDYLGRVSPEISAVEAKAITQNEAAIFWQTSESATTQVEYGTTAEYGSQTPEDTVPTTIHMFSLKGLKRATLYHFRVMSRDAHGNFTASEDFTFTTVDPVAGWKTYSDSLLDFKIKYLPEWVFETGDSGMIPGYDYDAVIFGQLGNDSIGLAIILWDLNKPENQSLKSYAEETLTAQLNTDWKEDFLPEGPTVEWYEVKYENLTWLGVITNDGKAGGYFTAKGAKVYSIETTFLPSRDQIELMMTTFE